MAAPAPLTIRSRHGWLRDLLPFYQWWQVTAAIAVMAATLWFAWLIHWKVPPILLMYVAWGYLAHYQARPMVLRLSSAQAGTVEAVMAGEGFFTDGGDGSWHLSGKHGGRARDVLTLEASGDAVDVTGPKPWLESIRNYTEWVDAGGVPLSDHSKHPFQIGEIEDLPWHAHVPSALIGAIIVPLFFYEMATGRIAQWGLSGKALAEGRFENILLHMVEHGSVMHILMNGAALAAIGGTLANRLGAVPLNWMRLLLLFVASGLAGGALYLALHPFGEVPMVGASGALYGMIGLLIRLPHKDEAMRALQSTNLRRMSWALIRENLFLIALLGFMAWESGSSGGLAWEAHLGGFLFGYFIGPKLLPRALASGG